MRILITCVIVCGIFVSLAGAQDRAFVAAKTPPLAQSRFFLPHNWIRGYTDFQVAPSHNEPDLGRCAFPQPLSAGGAGSSCTAYARYLFSGYLEIQPIGRTFARHVFLFLEPKMSFGKNIPQLS